jgi:hypothetical protein
MLNFVLGAKLNGHPGVPVVRHLAALDLIEMVGRVRMLGGVGGDQSVPLLVESGAAGAALAVKCSSRTPSGTTKVWSSGKPRNRFAPASSAARGPRRGRSGGRTRTVRRRR